jgi:hypothetical protein
LNSLRNASYMVPLTAEWKEWYAKQLDSHDCDSEQREGRTERESKRKEVKKVRLDESWDQRKKKKEQLLRQQAIVD